jgi:hypothetical protein
MWKMAFVHGYSSDVRLNLLVGAKVIALAQIGPGYVILREADDIAPCDAEISIAVDGSDRRISVRLVDGIQPFDRSARTMQCVSG